MSKNIKTIEVETTKEVSVDEKIQKSMNKHATEITKTVMNATLDALEKRSTEMFEHFNKIAKPREVIIGVKINDEDMKKLKVAAHPELANVINLLSLGLTPLLVGPSGCGKTFLAEQCAEALSLAYGHLCFSAGVSETWLYGRQTPAGFIEGEFARLYREGGIFLADEIDAADPNLLLTMNTALANDHMYNPMNGTAVKRHKDFHFIGAANTYGKGGNSIHTGRSRLDAATLDRFTILEVNYLSDVEDNICPEKEISDWLRSVRKTVLEKGSQEVVSYRAFDKAYKLYKTGTKKKEIASMLFASWPETTRKAVGV